MRRLIELHEGRVEAKSQGVGMGSEFATRDEFLAIVSHDLRNLLNAIVGSAALIEKGALQTDLVEQVVTHARRIQRAGARMNRLIGDLVDVASIEAGVR